MKKITLLLVLTIVLAASVFADNGGIIHTGGRAVNPETDRQTEIQRSNFYSEIVAFFENLFR